MAILIPFCNLISLFSSINYDQEYELSFWSEIYGCVNALGLQYETVMSMPVYIRKFWIQKHNMEAERIDREERNALGGASTIGGEVLNDYAQLELSKRKELGY